LRRRFSFQEVFMASENRPAPFTRYPDPAPEVIEEARRRFEAGAVSPDGLAQEFSMGLSALRRRLLEWGWTRPDARRNAGRAGRRSTTRRRGKRGDNLLKLKNRLRTAVEKRVASLEQALAAPDGAERIEDNVHVLASLVKTLAEFARLEGRSNNAHERDADADGAGFAGNLARLRTDLADRLGGAGRVDGDTEGTGDL
jgi:hypothetical protein